MNTVNKDIIECEAAYTKCFSEWFEDGSLIRFRDPLLPDMYDHNCTYIKNPLNAEELTSLIELEIQRNIPEGKDYCKFMADFSPDGLLLPGLKYKPEFERFGYYCYRMKTENRANTNAVIAKVDSPQKAEDVLRFDLANDGERLGEDFCRRRAKRRCEAYLSAGGVDSYLCYHEGNPVGSCNLLIHNRTAKIEDFSVLSSQQRKGFGASLLQHLIHEALDKGATTIYLVTDEEDTAKEMYLKQGFEKTGEKYSVFFKL